MRFNTGDTPQEDTNQESAISLDSIHSDLDNFSAKKTEFDKLKAQLIENFRTSLNSLAVEIFKNIPQLKAISWLQYAPYFNDGDECVFNIREIIFYGYVPDLFLRYAEDFEVDEAPEGAWAYADYELKDSPLSENEIKFLKKFDSVINSNKEFIKEIFGADSKVSWTASGIQVEDYTDHN